MSAEIAELPGFTLPRHLNVCTGFAEPVNQVPESLHTALLNIVLMYPLWKAVNIVLLQYYYTF